MQSVLVDNPFILILFTVYRLFITFSDTRSTGAVELEQMIQALDLQVTQICRTCKRLLQKPLEYLQGQQLLGQQQHQLPQVQQFDEQLLESQQHSAEEDGRGPMRSDSDLLKVDGPEGSPSLQSPVRTQTFGGYQIETRESVLPHTAEDVKQTDGLGDGSVLDVSGNSPDQPESVTPTRVGTVSTSISDMKESSLHSDQIESGRQVGTSPEFAQISELKKHSDPGILTKTAGCVSKGHPTELEVDSKQHFNRMEPNINNKPKQEQLVFGGDGNVAMAGHVRQVDHRPSVFRSANPKSEASAPGGREMTSEDHQLDPKQSASNLDDRPRDDEKLNPKTSARGAVR